MCSNVQTVKAVTGFLVINGAIVIKRITMTPKQKTKAIAIIGGLISVAGIIYLVTYFKKRKQTRGDDQSAKNPLDTVINKVSSAISPWPLKKGSNNKYVTELQTALINVYGTSILPKYGADGNWGSETDAAVKSKIGISSIKDEATFKKIIQDLNTKAAIKTITPMAAIIL